MELKERLGSLVESYYSAVSTLSSVLFPSPYYTVALSSFGSDGISVPLVAEKLNTSQAELSSLSEGKTVISIAQLYPPTVTCCLRDLSVSGFLLDQTGSCDNLQLIAIKCDDSCGYKVISRHVDANSEVSDLFSQIKGESAYSELDPVKCLSLAEPLSNNLAMYQPKGIVQLSHERLDKIKVKPFPVKQPIECLVGLRCHVALATNGWDMTEWLTRVSSSKWLKADLVAKVAAEGPTLLASSKGYWSTDWENCEKLLWQNVDPFLRDSFIAALQLLQLLFKNHVSVRQSVCSFLVRHTFLHCLEEGQLEGIQSSAQAERTHWSNVKTVLSRFSSALQSNYLEHYFEGKTNLFNESGFSMDDRIKLMNAIRDVQSSGFHPSTDLTGVVQSQHLDISSTDACEVQLTLAVLRRGKVALRRLFSDQVRLWHMKLYTMLNSTDEPLCTHTDQLQVSLRTHTDQLSLLTRLLNSCDRQHRDLLEWVSLVVSNSQASVYCALSKEDQGSGFFQRNTGSDNDAKYRKLAEEQYLRASNMDLLAGRVSLANYLHQSGRDSECLELVDEILHMTGYQEDTTECGYSGPESISSACTSPDSEWVSLEYGLEAAEIPSLPIPSPADFLTDVTQRNVVLNILVQRPVRKILTPTFRRNITLCTTPLAPGTNLYLLEPQIVARILRAVSLMGVNRPEDAVTELIKVRHLCEKEPPDLNERRTAAYHNVLAQCFIDAGHEQEARIELDRSIRIMSNPGNPGRWMLAGINSQKTRERMKQGLGVVAAIGSAAVVFGVLKSKIG